MRYVLLVLARKFVLRNHETSVLESCIKLLGFSPCGYDATEATYRVSLYFTFKQAV